MMVPVGKLICKQIKSHYTKLYWTVNHQIKSQTHVFPCSSLGDNLIP